MADATELKVQIDDLIDAWEKLEGGKRHNAAAVQTWLDRHMGPAIKRASKVIGRKLKFEGEPA